MCEGQVWQALQDHKDLVFGCGLLIWAKTAMFYPATAYKIISRMHITHFTPHLEKMVDFVWVSRI